jgi:proline iminopeptidase
MFAPTIREGTVRAADGIVLRVREGGEGPHLILCHGGPGLWDNLSDLGALLSGSSRVWRYDQRGCGRSAGQDGPYTVETFAGDLDAVRAHTGRDRVIVGGHSWGATLALLYATAHPDRVLGLFYIVGTGIEWPRWKAVYRRERDRRLTATPFAELTQLDHPTKEQIRELQVLGWAADHPDLQTGVGRARDLVGTGIVNSRCNAALSAEVDAISDPEWRERCSRLRAPSLVIQGDRDPRPVASVDSFARALPSCRRVVLPSAGHYPWLDAPGAFRNAVEGWLGALEAG